MHFHGKQAKPHTELQSKQHDWQIQRSYRLPLLSPSKAAHRIIEGYFRTEAAGLFSVVLGIQQGLEPHCFLGSLGWTVRKYFSLGN